MSKKKDRHEQFEGEVTASLPSLSDYRARYDKAILRTDKKFQDDLKFIISKIQKNRSEYEKVEKETKVPWFFVACLHSLESSLDFSTWLANGDPLSAPTRQVPAGLKLAPNSPHSAWVNGAIVSLQHEGFDSLHFDTIEECLAAAELYNGTGYLTGKQGQKTTPPRTSPYLWSGTNQYVKGKYVSDGRFDPEAVSQQIGVVPLLKMLKTDEVPVKKATWFEIFRTADSNAIVGYEGSQPVLKVLTNEIKTLIEVMQKNPGANTFRVAPSEKEVPDLGSVVIPKEGESFLLLQRAQNAPRGDGLVPLVLEAFDNLGQSRASFRVISGLPKAQSFRIGSQSMSGSFEPLPEGLWSVADIEFAAGKDNYDGSWGVGLGAVWVGVSPLFNTRRAAIGFHFDAGVLGTAGCIGFESIADLRKFVQILRAHDPKKLFVNWGLGTCPAHPKIVAI